MDEIAGLLEGPRARGAFLLRCVFDPPWSLRIEDEAPLTIMAVVSGSAVVRPEGEAPVHLAAGDVAVACGPDPYVVADAVDTAPQVVVSPGQECATLWGADVSKSMSLGVRTWGNSPGGATVMLTGTYLRTSEISRRLMLVLPRLLVLRASDWESSLVALLRTEVGRDEPGQEAVLDRLLDLLLVAVLRAWLSRPEAEPPGWYQAQTDPVVGPAIRLLQNDPAQPWTVSSLADQAGVSRAALARRFTDLVGEPPMTFLTDWRLSLAADMLQDSDATLAAVAQRVGYGSAFALSAAFKRVRGVSPKEHRLARSV